MDDKEIDKIVKLVKDGKITVSNDTLAFTKDYVKKQKNKIKEQFLDQVMKKE